MVQWVKPPPVNQPPIWPQVCVPATSLLIRFPANDLEKAMKDGPGAQMLESQVNLPCGDPDQLLTSAWLIPGCGWPSEERPRERKSSLSYVGRKTFKAYFRKKEKKKKKYQPLLRFTYY